jgi:hypothetical protein
VDESYVELKELSPQGEGRFTCHSPKQTLPSVELKGAMAVAYVRPVGMKVLRVPME